jgi:hypothetical protein
MMDESFGRGERIVTTKLLLMQCNSRMEDARNGLSRRPVALPYFFVPAFAGLAKIRHAAPSSGAPMKSSSLAQFHNGSLHKP